MPEAGLNRCGLRQICNCLLRDTNQITVYIFFNDDIYHHHYIVLQDTAVLASESPSKADVSMMGPSRFTYAQQHSGSYESFPTTHANRTTSIVPAVETARVCMYALVWHQPTYSCCANTAVQCRWLGRPADTLEECSVYWLASR